MRRLFPRVWNELTDEQHRNSRRGYLVHDREGGGIAGCVVVQVHESLAGPQLWVRRLEVRSDLRAESDAIERELMTAPKHLATKHRWPLLTIVTPERTDFLRTLGFVAWRIHRSVAVPPCTPPAAGRPAHPVLETTTDTSTPPRICDCWAMLWQPAEPAEQDDPQ